MSDTIAQKRALLRSTLWSAGRSRVSGVAVASGPPQFVHVPMGLSFAV